MYYSSGTGGTLLQSPIRLLMRNWCVFTVQVTALCCVKWRHWRHLECVTSIWKPDAVNWCVFTWRIINFIHRKEFRLISLKTQKQTQESCKQTRTRIFLPNFIPIRFETTETFRLFWRGRPNRKKKNNKNDKNDKMSSDWLIWDQFLIRLFLIRFATRLL